MKGFSGKQKVSVFLYVFSMVFLCFSALALTLNPLLIEGFQASKIGSLFHSSDDYLFVIRKNQEQHEVVKINLSNSQAKVLLSQNESQLSLSSEILELNGVIHLAAKKSQGSQLQLYRLNSSESFEPVTDLINYKTITRFNNGVFIQLQNLSLLWTDGHTVKTHLTSKTSTPLCFFSNNHFIFAEGLAEKFNIAIYQQGGIDYPFSSYYFEETETRFAHTADACLLSAYNENDEPATLYFNKNDEFEVIEKEYEFIGASDQYFFTLEPITSIHSAEPLHKLDQHSLETLSSNRILDRTDKIVNIISNHDRHILLSKASDYTTTLKVTFLSPQLNILSENLSIKEKHKIISNYNSDLILTDDKLLIYQGGSESYQLPINPQLEHQLVANKSLNRSFYTNELANNSKATSQIYSLDQKPNIGQLMAGTWVDPNFKSQGVSITPGIRSDGSRYIFLAVYTFKDGQPLWLAGTFEYETSIEIAEIELYEFQGANFIDSEATPSSEIVGSLQLFFDSCSTMQGTLTYENINQSLNLTRIDDTSYNYLCVE